MGIGTSSIGTSSRATTLDSAGIPTDLIWRLTVGQYHEMIRTGIPADDPVELLEGWLVAKLPKRPAHRGASQLAREALTRCVPAGWHVQAQDPITTDTSEPEPDVSVVRGGTRDYLTRHPRPEDLEIVVEVAETSLKRDRGRKKRIYARTRIPVYWIINPSDSQIELYHNPSGATQKPDDRSRRVCGPSDQIPVVIDSIVVAKLKISELLP